MRLNFKLILGFLICNFVCSCGTSKTAEQEVETQRITNKSEKSQISSTTAELEKLMRGEVSDLVETMPQKKTQTKEELARLAENQEFQEILAIFPEESSIPEILLKCMSTDPDILELGEAGLKTLEGKMSQGELSIQETQGLFAAYTRLTFPKPQIGPSLQGDVGYILYLTPKELAQELAAEIKAIYSKSTWREQNTFLVILSGARSAEAANAFVECIQSTGWPDPTYPRVFWDLDRLHAHADVLYPAILLNATDENLFSLAALISETDRDQVTPELMEPITSMVQQRLETALENAQSYQETPEDWFVEDYLKAQENLFTFLKLAGRTNDSESNPLIQAAMEVEDPLIVSAAVAAGLNRGMIIPETIIETMAANHRTRASLFESLEQLNQLEQFPKKWRTWDAFACSEMVQWLSHPAELGTAPHAIEQMEVVEIDSDAKKRTIYVWRFREDPDSEWLAGISGPYILNGEPCPVHGNLTFSQFINWDSAPPKKHVDAVVQMFTEYRERNEE